MEKQFKSLEFIYQDMEIHFLVNPNEKNVMINATEMAKAFNKRIHNFLKAEHTQHFMSELENYYASLSSNGDSEKPEILKTNTNLGTYMCEPLALKFAAWLEPKFELWIYQRIQDVIFGNYKKHWDAHQKQEQAKLKIAVLKNKLLTEPTVETAIEYFETEKIINETRSEKQKALLNQYKIEGL